MSTATSNSSTLCIRTPMSWSPPESCWATTRGFISWEPLTYQDMVLALREAALILTDSGGIQEEAPTFGAPVLVLREVTERPEALETGAVIVGSDEDEIVAEDPACSN